MRFTRSIVRHYHLEVSICLVGQTTQYRQQGVTAVVGRDHDGNELGRIHFELDYMAYKTIAERESR